MATYESHGPFLNITTKDGELLQRIDLSEYDLARPIARQALLGEIITVVTNQRRLKVARRRARREG